MTLDEILLMKYLQGECTQEESALISAWLKESEENRKMLFNLELLLQLPDRKAFEREETVILAEKKLLSRIENLEVSIQNQAKKRRNKKRMLNWISSVAAAAVIIGGIFLLDTTTAPNNITLSASDIDPIKEVILPDGSKVWLNRGGALTYSEQFGKSNREIYLEGEAYFNVAHNEEMPFVVSSAALQATVLGTQFNMHSYGNKELVHVSLIEGAVEVKGMNGEGQIVLSPSQRAELDLVSKRMTVKTVNAKLDAVWHNNLIPFSDASIYDIANTLEQLYNVKFVFSENLNIPGFYAGSIQQKDGIEDVLRSLMNSIPFVYTINGNTVRVSNK